MDHNFSVNHPLLFILAGVAVFVVALQSVVFLRKAWKRALELGFSKEKLKKLAISAAVFSIAPAIAVGIGVITLAGTLGIPLPWLRLSVVGAIMYELSAAETAASALGTSLTGTLSATEFSAIAWTMTIGITTGLRRLYRPVRSVSITLSHASPSRIGNGASAFTPALATTPK